MANNFGSQRPLTKGQLKKLVKQKAEAEKEKQRDEDTKKAIEDASKKAEAKKEADLLAKKDFRKKNPSTFPAFFSDASAELLINSIDFSQAEYVVTENSSDGMETRKAFVHYSYHDKEAEEKDTTHDLDCWVGGNIHPDGYGGWIPGHSYILEYPKFQVQTSAGAVGAISKLPASFGTKPPML